MAPDMAARTTDGGILPSIEHSESGCYVGIEFPAGHVGVLNEIRFFLDAFSREKIVDNLVIEGSSDKFAKNVVTLATISEEAREGWNEYDLSESAEPAKYQSYRLRSTATSSGCNGIGEIQYLGYEVIDDESDSYSCKIELVDTRVDEAGAEHVTKQDLGETVTYQLGLTPAIDDISPRWGAVSGGTQLTFTARNLISTNPADYTITIDDVNCPVDSVFKSEIRCTTGPRIGEWGQPPKVEIYVNGAGKAALQDNTYRYCSLWSEQSTWGSLLPPMDGESVAVPKGLCLLVDIQNSPKLKLVQVDGGALIFPSNDADQNYEATFDAEYIVIKDGLMEVGTEKHPYQSKLTITMHGEKYGAPVPMFGKKVIGIHSGTLDIHGRQKVSWTELDSTVMPKDASLTLVEAVDWEAGDEVMITTTDYDFRHTEHARVISNTV
jgi:hypothetical protein